MLSNLINTDITILSDVRLISYDLADLKRQTFQSHFVVSSNSLKKRGGVCILLKRSLNFKIFVTRHLESPENQGGRALFIQIHLSNSTKLNIGACYISPSGISSNIESTLDFFQSCLLKYPSKFSCLAGDMNCHLDLDTGPARTLMNFMRHNHLLDAYRFLVPNIKAAPGFTYNGDQEHSPSRVDYILTSDSLSESINKTYTTVCNNLNKIRIQIKLL